MYDHLGDRNLTQLLHERVEAHGDRTFLVFEDREGARSELTTGSSPSGWRAAPAAWPIWG